MRPRSVTAFSIALILAAAAGLARPYGQAPASKTKAGASQPVFLPASGLKWTDLDPAGAPGVKVADLWGDHTKGLLALLRAACGIRRAPAHPHPRHEGGVPVGHLHPGTRRQGRGAARSGSYMMQPGGNYRHTTTCDKASECVFFVESSGAFDLKPVAGGPAPAKK